MIAHVPNLFSFVVAVVGTGFDQGYGENMKEPDEAVQDPGAMVASHPTCRHSNASPIPDMSVENRQ